MKLIDLTSEPGKTAEGRLNVERRDLHLQSPGVEYTGVIYEFKMSSMAGTYIDFPGHIAETDDGRDAFNYPLEKLYRRRAAVIRLDRRVGGVTASELAAACPVKIRSGDALIVNALGDRQFYEVGHRSVFFEMDAVEWIIEQGVELLVSDIYESQALLGVFLKLFKAGISTVCCPVDLDKLEGAEVKLTLMPLPVRGVTQIPCRLVAEII